MSLGVRFSDDYFCPHARFDRLREEFQDDFVRVNAGGDLQDIDSSPGNPHGISSRAHSVLTASFVDQKGHPTRQALDEVLEFLDKQLNRGRLESREGH